MEGSCPPPPNTSPATRHRGAPAPARLAEARRTLPRKRGTQTGLRGIEDPHRDIVGRQWYGRCRRLPKEEGSRQSPPSGGSLSEALASGQWHPASDNSRERRGWLKLAAHCRVNAEFRRIYAETEDPHCDIVGRQGDKLRLNAGMRCPCPSVSVFVRVRPCSSVCLCLPNTATPARFVGKTALRTLQ